MQQEFNADTVTAMLALVGASIDPASAANVAEALNTQVPAVHKACAAVPFEAEPSGYLRASAGTPR